MKLFTKELMKKIPATSTQNTPCLGEVMIYAKLFLAAGNWSWYVAEADFETGYAFGYVKGFENEWGYFDLNELAELKGPFGLGVERDRYFRPKNSKSWGNNGN